MSDRIEFGGAGNPNEGLSTEAMRLSVLSGAVNLVLAAPEQMQPNAEMVA